RRIDLGLVEPRPRGVAIGRGVVERCLGRDLAAGELGYALVLRFRLFQRRLGGGLRGPRLLELELVWLGLDGEQRGTLLHHVAVLVMNFLDEALHARDQVGAIHRRGVAGRLEIAGDRFRYGQRDRHLRRRRGHVTVVLPAGGG